jgi:hypothetical protein
LLPEQLPNPFLPTAKTYNLDFIGADTKSRTRDLLITNQLLYQLSYAGAGVIIETGKRGSKLMRALQKAIEEFI